MKRFLIILAAICLSSLYIKAEDVLYKCTKDTVQLYNSKGIPSFLKMHEGETVWIIGKTEEWVQIKYAKTGALFLVKPEDIY